MSKLNDSFFGPTKEEQVMRSKRKYAMGVMLCTLFILILLIPLTPVFIEIIKGLFTGEYSHYFK